MLSFYTFIKYLQQNFLAIHRANKTISKAYWAQWHLGLNHFGLAGEDFSQKYLDSIFTRTRRSKPSYRHQQARQRFP